MNDMPKNLQRDHAEFRATLAPLVSQICDKLGVMLLLDFYCGDNPIMNHLNVGHKMKIQCYDPLIARFMESPLAADMVFFCPKVEPTADTIDEVESLTRAVCMVALETEDCDKWIVHLSHKFEMQTFQRINGGFYAILYCRPDIKICVT